MHKTNANLLAGYIKKATSDARLNTSHLSIYMALLACWQEQDYCMRFTITRREVMKRSKIAAISTYHRSMKQLIGYGYFKYEPTYDTYTGTKVTFI